MSFYICLRTPVRKLLCTVPNFDGDVVIALSKGSEIRSPKTAKAGIKVTGNYHVVFNEAFPENGIIWLNERTGAETIEVLTALVDKLGSKPTDDYWEASPGNCG